MPNKTVLDTESDLSDSMVAYQVAIRFIGESHQHFVMAIEGEKNSDAPNTAVIEENEKCLDRLFDLRHNLRLEDADLIAQIIDPNSAFRKNLAAGIISYQPTEN